MTVHGLPYAGPGLYRCGVDERFNYKKEDTDDPSFIGIFCASCDQEIGYEDCPDCDADKEKKSASSGAEETDDDEEYVLHSVGERTVKIDEITLLDSRESDSEKFLALLLESSPEELQLLVVEHTDCWLTGDLCELDALLFEELGLRHCVVPSVMGAPNVSVETLIFATQLGSADADWASILAYAIMDSPAITSDVLQQTQVWNSDQAWELFLHPLVSVELAQSLENEYSFLDRSEPQDLISTIIETKLARASEKKVHDYFSLGEILYNEKIYSRALPILKAAADLGHNLAAEKTANCYSKLGYPELAVPYWEFCRTEGNHSANTNYANYLTSIGKNVDFALKLWREAADAGISHAAFNLGVWLKNSGEMAEGKIYLTKSGDLGYDDGYYVLAGIYYKAQDWENMNNSLAPLLEKGDKRAVTMQKAAQDQLKRNV